MLLETMTPKEMVDELHKDFDQMHDKNLNFLERGGMRNLRRPGSKFPAYITKEQRSSRGNRYICIFLFRRRTDVFRLKVAESRLALLETKEGMTVVALAYSSKYQREVLYIYRPHVFKRYKERMGLDLDGLELITHFDKRNADTLLYDEYKHKEGDMENDIMLTVQDGALFGTKSEADGCICYTINTFIANDTMQEGYKSKFNSRYNQTIDEIKETLDQFGVKNEFIAYFQKRKE